VKGDHAKLKNWWGGGEKAREGQLGPGDTGKRGGGGGIWRGGNSGGRGH